MSGGVLRRTPGAGLLVDGETVVRDANERCRVVFQCDLGDIVGTSLPTLADSGYFDEESLLTFRESVTSVLAGDIGERTARVTITPAGTDDRYPYYLRVTPVDGDDGSLACCSLRSVGTHQRYEETVTALHHATRELMGADTRREVFERAASAAADVLGFPGTAVREHDREAGMLRHVAFGSVVANIDSRPPYPVDDSPHGEALQRGETVIDDIEPDDPYDRDVFTQTMYTPIGEEGVLSLGTVGDTFDETDVQFAEILAENTAAALDVVDTTASLRRERERLRQLKQVRSRVLRHDMRNALTVLLARGRHLAELTDGTAQSLAEDVVETASDISDTVEQTRQIESVIGRLDAEAELSLSTVLAEATDVEDAPSDATVETVVERDGEFVAHPQFPAAVENLVENAIVHGDGTAVEVRGTVADGQAVIEVADDGPGIPPNELEVFEQRRETALKHSQGTGLWLVDLVVGESGGEWCCESDDDGTTVRITVPR